jgi:hypothetical protein
VNRTYTGKITKLEDNQIFCFGSNTQGRHGKGTGKLAIDKFGAIYGQPRGLQGRSYGIVTTDLTKFKRPSVSYVSLCIEIQNLYEFAVDNPNLDFLIAYTGLDSKNLSGFTNSQLADIFSLYKIPDNIIFEKEFSTLLKRI